MLRIDFEFPFRQYGGTTPYGQEYPPSPLRVLAAFVAANSDNPEHIHALMALEGLSPVILASPTFRNSLINQAPIFEHGLPRKEENSSSYRTVVDAAQFLAGHGKTGLRTPLGSKPATFLGGSNTVSFFYSLDQKDPSDSVISSLSQLAGKISFLGPSSDPVVVTAREVSDIEIDNRSMFVPHLGKNTLATPHLGFVSAAEDRYKQELSPKLLPRHVIRQVPYGIKSVSFEGREFSVLHFSSVKSQWAAQFQKVAAAVPEATVIPLVLRSGQLYGLAAEIPPEKIGDLYQSTVESFGEDTEFGDAWLKAIVDGHTAWESFTPVLASRNSILAQAKVMADISTLTGLPPEEFMVALEPVLFNETAANPGLLPGTEYVPWMVRIQFARAVKGPICVGEKNQQGWGFFRHLEVSKGTAR